MKQPSHQVYLFDYKAIWLLLERVNVVLKKKVNKKKTDNQDG